MSSCGFPATGSSTTEIATPKLSIMYNYHYLRNALKVRSILATIRSA